MKDDKKFFEITPPENHTKRVESAVEDLLAEKRRSERRKWMAWIAGPAFASFAGLFLWKRQSTQEKFSPEQAVLLQIEDEEELEMLADIDIIEDLEFLEEWDGSTEG